mgnify:CR=1 FL=1
MDWLIDHVFIFPGVGNLIILLLLFVMVFGTPIFILMRVDYSRTVGKQKAQKKQQFKNVQDKGFIPERVFKRPKDVPGWDSFEYEYLAFDFTHSLFAYEDQIGSLQDVVAAELINDSTVVQTASAYQDGAAVLGGILPGVGVMVGRSQMNAGEKTAVVAVRVMLDNPRLPSVVIPFLFGVADKASKQYQDAVTTAYDAYSVFESVIRINKRNMNRS